jgi:tRNA U55 pseudouridine synthase TruB
MYSALKRDGTPLYRLARELKLRHAPRIEFQLDTDIERAAQLTQLIDSAVKADRSRGTAEGGAAEGGTAEDEPQAADEEP